MISKWELLSEEHQTVADSNENIVASFSTSDSPADELFKIARLKSEGIINEQEFARLKQNIIEGIH